MFLHIFLCVFSNCMQKKALYTEFWIIFGHFRFFKAQFTRNIWALNSWVLHPRRCGILPMTANDSTHPTSYVDAKRNGYNLTHNMSDPKQPNTSLICSYVYAVWGLWSAIWQNILRDFLKPTSFYNLKQLGLQRINVGHQPWMAQTW